MKLYKSIKTNDAIVTIYGSNRAIKIDYATPKWKKTKKDGENEPWDKESEPFFRYRNNRYYLSEIMSVTKNVSDCQIG